MVCFGGEKSYRTKVYKKLLRNQSGTLPETNVYAPLKIGHPKRIFHLPTINFHVFLLLVSEMIVVQDGPKNTTYRGEKKNIFLAN